MYCPYPPGLIPSDLTTELERVRREVRGIEQEAMAQSAALGPLTPTSPAQTLAGNGMRAVQILGKLENYDENLSVFKNVACASCHMPYAGFSGPISSLNQTTVAYPGSFHFRWGKRKPQSYDYSPRYPVLNYNQTQANFYGGNFWDLRATGYKLQSPDSEQAQGPPLDPLEMGNPDFGCIVFRLSQARYRPLFEAIWGKQAFDIKFPPDTKKICSTPAGAFGNDPTPLRLSPSDRGIASATYDAFAHALTGFENGPEVSPFSSKFDAFLAGSATLTADEMAGYSLFRGKGNCNSCHLDGRSTAPSTQKAPNGVDTGAAADLAPLFTDTTSANLGLPKNPAIPFYYEDKPDSFGLTPNPAGFGFTDLGVGLFLRGLSGVNPNADWTQFAPRFDVRFVKHRSGDNGRHTATGLNPLRLSAEFAPVSGPADTRLHVPRRRIPPTRLLPGWVETLPQRTGGWLSELGKWLPQEPYPSSRVAMHRRRSCSPRLSWHACSRRPSSRAGAVSGGDGDSSIQQRTRAFRVHAQLSEKPDSRGPAASVRR